MVSRAPIHLSHLLQNKQDTSGIFSFIFTSLITHYVNLWIVIETVISKTTSGQETSAMSVLFFKSRIKQASKQPPCKVFFPWHHS